jgi:hypothetical protein
MEITGLLEGKIQSIVLTAIYMIVLFPQLAKCIEMIEKCRKIPKDSGSRFDNL